MFIWLNMNSIKYSLLMINMLFFSANALAENNPSSNKFEWMPGASHVISNALSASRDTAYPTSQFTPRQTQRGGIEFALFGVQNQLGEFRFSSHGFIELESNNDDTNAFFDARHGVDFWRGNYGYGVSQTLNGFAKKYFRPHSQVEFYIGWRHESEHFTGSEAGADEPQYWQAPHMGDWIQIEQALRTPYSNFRHDIRFIEKYFLTDPDDNYRSFNYGFAVEFILEYKPEQQIHPYSASYVEYINGNEWDFAGISAEVPDVHYLYQHFGISIKGQKLSLNIFTSLKAGNGKGKLMLEKEQQWGWGISIGII